MAILKYIGRRLLVLIPVLLGISLAAFLLGRIAPGDPVDDALFRIGIEFPTEEDRADMRAELGLDRPLPVQYLDWLGDALRGDLGRSYIGNKDIAQELMTRLPITLKVSLAAMLAAVVFGVGGGVLMAACHGTWLDTVLKGLSTLLLSVPGFWLALFLITVFAEWLHLLPTSGLDRGLASLVLPAVALSAANVGSTSRFTRGNILAQLGEQYIVVANAKGLSQRAVMVGHAFRNSLVPIITLIGNYFGGILGGSTIIENIFAIPGLGSYVLSAIQNRDYPVIQGYVLITGTTFVLVTLAIDLLYIAVNPKIRLQGRGMTRRRKQNIKLALVCAILGAIVLMTIFAPWLAPYDPLEVNMELRLLDPCRAHPLGTDALGRDVLSRVIYGGRASLLLAVVATACSMAVGLVIGVAAGYCGGIVDGVITAVSNVFQGLPGMVLMIALVGVLERGTRSIILALVITSWVGFSRLVRGEVMKVKSEMYVEGMRCLGAGHLRIVLRHVLPNIRTNVILQFTTRVGRVVLSVAGLSYLGLGIEPPTPDWGEMVSGTARRYFRSAPHLLWVPGICIILLTLSINLLGDLLRDRLDVKQDAVKEL